MQTVSFLLFVFVLGFYGPVNNEVEASRSINGGTVPGQASKRLTSTKQGRPGL